MTIDVFDAHMTAGQTLAGDLPPEALLGMMDRHGVQRAMLSPIDRWLAVDNQEGNDTLLAWCRLWPDRLTGYATANPWYGQRAVAELSRALDAGLPAIKLHPARQGFMLLDSVVNPVLSLAARRCVPVYVTTGIPVASLPFQLAEIARRYPEVPFIMGRSGRTDFGLDLFPAARQAPNIYIETAYNLPDVVAAALETVGENRVLFASDAPLTNLQLELAKLDRLEVTPAVRGKLMSGNLARLLGFPEVVNYE